MKNNNLKKIVNYGVFFILAGLIVLTFVTATSYIQLAIATLLYPPIVYYAFRYFRKSKKEPVKPLIVIQPVVKKVSAEQAEKNRIEIADIDKRAFLKLIGAAGLVFFLSSIFAKKVEALLPGKGGAGLGTSTLEDSYGNKINLAERQPTDGYKITEIDNGEFTYYGFVNKRGNWYIMREDPVSGSFRYAKGDLNFPVSWTNREHLKYDYFHSVFS